MIILGNYGQTYKKKQLPVFYAKDNMYFLLLQLIFKMSEYKVREQKPKLPLNKTNKQ